MPLAQTLERVQEDIRTGDFGKACARLHGLIGSYPEDLDLRRQLGEVYWNLHMPAMAGRYWYLVDNKDERMQAACKRFEDEFRNDPYHILSALKFKGDREATKDAYASRVLDDLERRAREKHPWYAGFRQRGLEKNYHSKNEMHPHKVRDILTRTGCLIALGIITSLVLIGLFTTISTVVKWLR